MFIINSYKYASGGSSPDPLTTLIDDALEFWSLRVPVGSEYESQNCIRVRKKTGGAEQDFGYVDGLLDTASILTFIGSDYGFVTTWYGLKGSCNLTRSSATSQPVIVDNGSIAEYNSLPHISFNSVGGNSPTSLSCSGNPLSAADDFTIHNIRVNSTSTLNFYETGQFKNSNHSDYLRYTVNNGSNNVDMPNRSRYQNWSECRSIQSYDSSSSTHSVSIANDTYSDSNSETRTFSADTSNFSLGYWWGSAQAHFEFGMWDRVLTAAEITTLRTLS